MNLVLFEPSEVVAGRARLAGERARHVRRVLGKAAGDEVRVGVVGQGVGRARILRVERDEVTLELGPLGPPPPASPHALALALPRPPMLRRVLQAATSFGIKEIHVFHGARVERSFWGSKALTSEDIEAQLRLGLEQAKDCVSPVVTLHRAFRPFVEDRLPEIAAGDPILLADPVGAPCPAAWERRCVLVVGPEGGLVDFEIDRLCEGGARRVSLGPRPLRVDVAVPALLGRLAPVPGVGP